MNKIVKTFSFLSTLLVFSGCGLVFGGKQANIAVNTNTGKPVNIEVQSSSGVQQLSAPGSLSVNKANSPITIKVKDKCYEETSQAVPNKIAILGYVNFLFGTFGTTSALVDINNGTFWTYDESVTVNAVKKPGCN